MASTGGGVASTAVVSGVFAALVAVAVTRAIELLGGQLGGVVATLPTTIVPASYGIAALAGIPLLAAAPASARPELVVAALYAFPAGTLVSSGFLAVWRLLPPALPQRWPLRVALPVMVVTSLSTWASCAALAVALARAATAPRAFGLACFAAQAALGISSTVRHRAAPRGAGAVPLRLLLLRGGLAGAVICFAVLLAAAAGDGGVAAGVATAFPVIFLTIQVSLWLGHDGTGQDGQGKAVQGGAVGPMMLGSLAVVNMRRTRGRRRLGGAPAAFAYRPPARPPLPSLALARAAGVFNDLRRARRFLRHRGRHGRRVAPRRALRLAARPRVAAVARRRLCRRGCGARCCYGGGASGGGGGGGRGGALGGGDCRDCGGARGRGFGCGGGARASRRGALDME